jgi:hypothetical protein
VEGFVDLKGRSNFIIVIFFFFLLCLLLLLHGLGHLTCSSINMLPSHPGVSKISSSSRLVIEGTF